MFPIVIHIQIFALHFEGARSCWHGQCFSECSDFSRGVFYDVLLRRLTTWRAEELPTLASPCKGRGERGARRVQITRRFLAGAARSASVSHALFLNPKTPRLQSRRKCSTPFSEL